MNSTKYRFAICVKCNKKWNISRFQSIPKSGYICPYCLERKKKVKKLYKYSVLFIIGILLYSISADVAYIQRGYKSIGGEVVFLFLPLWYFLTKTAIKDNLKWLKK